MKINCFVRRLLIGSLLFSSLAALAAMPKAGDPGRCSPARIRTARPSN